MSQERGIKKIKHFSYQDENILFKNFELKKTNKIIILDIAPKPIINELNRLRNKEILYIDHHQTEDIVTPEKILEYRTVNLGYIPVSRSMYEILKTDDWICLAGAIIDKKDLEEFKRNLLF